jgi:hypothetical protein
MRYFRVRTAGSVVDWRIMIAHGDLRISRSMVLNDLVEETSKNFLRDLCIEAILDVKDIGG